MSLSGKIDLELKTALKSKDSVRVSVIRMLKTAVTRKEKDVRRALEDDEIIKVISSQAKQRKDSIEQFKKGGRDDLADREEQELAILESYLPKQMGRDELEAAVASVIEETGAESIKAMGQVMKAVMSKYSGQVDGKAVQEIVKQQLSAK